MPITSTGRTSYGPELHHISPRTRFRMPDDAAWSHIDYVKLEFAIWARLMPTFPTAINHQVWNEVNV